MTNSELLNKLSHGYRHPKPVGCSDELYEILLNCWRDEPSQRPTFEHIYHTMEDYPVATESNGYRESDE